MVDVRTRRRTLLVGSGVTRQRMPDNMNLSYAQTGGTGLIADWTSSGDTPAWHTSAPLPSGRASYLRTHKAVTAVSLTHGPFATNATNYDTVDGFYFKVRMNAINASYGTCAVFGVKRPGGGSGSISMFSESDINAQLKIRFWDGASWIEEAYRTSTGGDFRSSYHNWVEGYIIGYRLWARYYRDSGSAPTWPFLDYDLKTLVAEGQRYQPNSLVLNGGFTLASYYTSDPYVGVSDVICNFGVSAP